MRRIGTYEISKQTVRDIADPNQVHDITSLIEDSPDVPNLLTTIMPIRTDYLETDTFEHDLRTTGVDEITDKPYQDRGDYVHKENVDTHLFKVPHWPIQGKVRPRDVLKQRMPGTTAVLDTTDRQVATEMGNMMNAFDAFSEAQLASTITTGTLYVPNATLPSYDFYDEYTPNDAANRPTVAFDLSNVASRPGESGEQVRKLIRNGLRDGDRMTGIAAVCGNDFFEQLIYQENVITPRENWAVPEALQNPLLRRLRDQGMDYRVFVGPDNITYINYDGQISTSTNDPLIAADEAYFFPQGNVDMMRKVFAPAETMQYVNTRAQEKYAWRYDSEFEGINIFMESNCGYYLINPSVLIKGIAGT